ncbi:MAG: hypothetical protein MUE34_17450, partial [Acidimicrobiales bacterium]|nr:hypothetical protein [Acidimicrobiales bacterium]
EAVLLCLPDIFFAANPFANLSSRPPGPANVLLACPGSKMTAPPPSGFLLVEGPRVCGLRYHAPAESGPSAAESLFWPGAALLQKSFLLPYLEAAVTANRQAPLEAFLEMAIAAGVPLEWVECAPFINVNTPADWLRCLPAAR